MKKTTFSTSKRVAAAILTMALICPAGGGFVFAEDTETSPGAVGEATSPGAVAEPEATSPPAAEAPEPATAEEPASIVPISGEAPTLPKTTREAVSISMPISYMFNDIFNHWAEDDILQLSQRGVFGGTEEGKFSPDTPMTRGMLVTVLGRLHGADISGYGGASAFSDVAASQYYAPYITWAEENGIVSGIGGGMFAPDSEITRQDLSVIILRYSEFAKKPFIVPLVFATFTDEANIADYAKNAIQTLFNAGIINGTGITERTISPLSSASRAEVASMLNRYLKRAI
jgi:hypothetical protein